MNLTIDLNTILTTLVLGCIVYTARTLKELEKTQALTTQQAATQDREMVALRARVTTTEAEVETLKIAVARFTAASGIDN